MQTVSDGHAGYTGSETQGYGIDADTGSEAYQAAWYTKLVDFAQCDADIARVNIFHLVDETDLGAWQSGLFYAGYLPKASSAPARGPQFVPMLIAVISDTHLPRGARRLPDACVERLRAADLILHAGDLAAASFLEELRALGPPVEAVCGNVDEPALASLLPETRIARAGKWRIGMVHDGGPRAGREARLRGRFPGCDAVVYGHSHLPQVERVEDVWILNPGSPTERRSAPWRSLIELRVGPSGLEPTLVRIDP